MSYKRQQIGNYALQNSLQTFKKQYDELLIKYEQKRKETQQLILEKRRLEVQVLNSNTQYYERQIKRLRGVVEKYLHENQKNKHSYIQILNKNNQLQSILKTKQKEIQNLINTTQTNKLNQISISHKNNQNQIKFNKIIHNLQQTIKIITNNYQKSNQNANSLEKKYKFKIKQNQQLENIKIKFKYQLQQKQQQCRKYKSLYDTNRNENNRIIQQLQQKYRKLIWQSKESISRLQDQIKDLKQHSCSEELLIKKKTENIGQYKTVRGLEGNVSRLTEINQQLEHQLTLERQLVQNLKKKIRQATNQEEIKKLEDKVTQLKNSKIANEKMYEQKNLDLQRTIEMIKCNNQKNLGGQIYNKGDIENLLRIQAEENTNMKKELSTKIDEVFNLKSELEIGSLKHSELENQIEILTRKHKTQEKNNKLQMDISLQTLKNEIDTLQRKYNAIENKLVYKTNEVSQKDTFIMSNIVGKSKPEDKLLIIAQFTRIFETNYVAKLIEAEKQIKQLTQMIQ